MEKLRGLVAGRVMRSAEVAKRSVDAGHNEMAVEVAGAGPLVRLGQGEYERAWWGNNGVPRGVVRHGEGA
jgi:hypothetical protein